MKTNKHLTLLLMLLLSGISMRAQQKMVESAESAVIMSEDDIISLVKTLREYKQKKYNSAALKTEEASIISHKTIENNTYEVDYLRKQISQLEQQIEELKTIKASANSNLGNNTNSLNARELTNIKYEVSQLKNLIRQLADRTNNDLTVVLPNTQIETKTEQSPYESLLIEQTKSNSQENEVLERKLDSLNMLFKNLKPTDNPDYSSDFNALEKKLIDLKNELSLKNTKPNAYEALSSKYKGFSRRIYFSNNSFALSTEGNQIVEELNRILDKNDNVDIVVKGFASNKGNALYNENLSMQRTESVKKALILRGIHPTRILTQYHGIDYSVANYDKARRVEISIIVRK